MIRVEGGWGCHRKISEWCGLNERNLFLSILEVKVQEIKVLAGLDCSEASLLGYLLVVSSHSPFTVCSHPQHLSVGPNFFILYGH
jgi:hypothetical protein